ncbi:unnamed protein product [Blepharisma stoltei]|uniref:Uncharacterized protein n=1 Tax=Blepharisma stoltei TaxID=1481888 RepID=A0AAU9IQ46_9CILI|nr:unnamed protein product [Blepharisma stoltei]
MDRKEINFIDNNKLMSRSTSCYWDSPLSTYKYMDTEKGVELDSVELSKITKSILYDHFAAIKQYIESCQAYIAKSASVLIDQIALCEAKAQQSLNESKKLCMSIMHEVNFPSSEKKGSYTEMALKLHPSKICDILPAWEFSEASIDLNSVINCLSNALSVSSLRSSIESSISKISDDIEEIEASFTIPNLNVMASFKSGTKNLIELDLKNNSQKVTALALPVSMSDHSSVCQLPDSSLFCFGSLYREENKNIFSGITFIVSPNYDIKILTSGQPRIKSGTIYFDSYIFAFGGDNGQALDFAEKYDFTCNLWKKVANLPETSENCSCALFKDEILVLVQKSKVFSYNPLSNSYSKMIEFHKHNIQQLCVANGKAYLLRSKAIYESEFEDATMWRNVCALNTPAGDTISYLIVDESTVFFMRYYDVYKFDFRKKRITCIYEHEKFLETEEDHKFKRCEEAYQ